VIKAEDLPANALLNLAKRAKRDLPPDLTANGTVSASFHAHRTLNAPPDWVGHLQVSRLLIHSSVLGKDLAVNKALATVNTTEPLITRRRGHLAKTEPPVRALILHNFDLPLGGNTPATVDGRFDGEQIAFQIKGDASLERLQQFARTVGVGAPKIALAGQAAIDLVIGGKWANFSSPEVTGTAQLKNVRAEVPGFSVPVEIGAAQVEMDGNRFELRIASAVIGKIALKGSASFPRYCDSELPCQSTFDLSTDEFNPERWNDVLNSRLRKKPWYSLFGAGEAERNVITNLHSTGRLTSRHLTLGTATGSAFETDFSLSSGLLELKNTRTDFLGGKVSGEWKIDFNGSEPKYESIGTAERVQIEKLGTLAKASLGSGILALKYKLEMSGWNGDDLAKSARSEAEFTWTGGVLKLSPHSKAPLRVTDGTGKATLGSQGWTISASKWNTPTGTYSLTGTASRKKAIAMEFTQEKGSVWKLTGTLLNPQSSTPALQSAQAKRR